MDAPTRLPAKLSVSTPKAATKPADPATVVSVAFRDLDARYPLRNFSSEHGYAYVWPFREAPRVGQWAIADGWSGPATVIVGSIGLPQHARGMELKSLHRLIPAAEVSAAQAERDAPALAWLDLARQATGLPVADPASDKVPRGFRALPPAQGTARSDVADKRAEIWWRAYRLATELGRDPEEVAAFKAAAQGWFRERDRALKAEQG